MSYKVLLLDNVDAKCAEVFRERGMEADQPGKLTDNELKERLGNYDAVVIRSATTITPEILEHAGNLKVIGRAGVGVDNIDIPASTAKGIIVMNTPDGNTISTAEHTCGMILSLARNIPAAVSTVKGGGWDRKKYMGSEIHNKTLGIVGLGKIGSEVARRMRAFEMKILAYDPFATHERAQELGVELVEIDELLKQSDFLTVHTPLTDKTRGLISLKNADKLNKGMRLVNCARGGIFEEADLVELLEKDIIGGVALDVYSTEPPTEDLYKILEHPKIVSTPHLGASTEEAQEKVAEQIAAQIADALEGKGYKGSLNSKSIALTTNQEVQPFLQLAEKLGSLVVQIAPEHTNSFKFEYMGESAPFAEVLTDGILKGMLQEYVSESVNLINARTFAADRGFDITESVTTKGGNYNDLTTVKLPEGSLYRSISASVFGEGDYRIVQIDDFNIELRLEGDILMYQNPDKPGMLASVSGKLASLGINIGALALGRNDVGSNAITALLVDKQLDDNELEEIRNLDGIRHVQYIQLH
jgi:D-3-phosphoglycerate dehydrogenase